MLIRRKQLDLYLMEMMILLFLCENIPYKDAYFIIISLCFKDINEISLN